MKNRKRPKHFHTAPRHEDRHVGGSRLPNLATAEQIAAVLQVTARTIHLWATAEPPVIPVALRQGKVVRFHPPDVAKALGISLPEFGP
jgi:hypothetical protein